jgi:hypothetical protein
MVEEDNLLLLVNLETKDPFQLMDLRKLKAL